MGLLRQEWLEHGLPAVSMGGICYIIAIIAANNQEKILTMGAGLFAAALVHNCLGYLLGYWGARATGVEERDARTVAFEVGMQYGGMGRTRFQAEGGVQADPPGRRRTRGGRLIPR